VSSEVALSASVKLTLLGKHRTVLCFSFSSSSFLLFLHDAKAAAVVQVGALTVAARIVVESSGAAAK
jgi:hypothetical protein